MILEREGIASELDGIATLQDEIREQPGVAAVVGPAEERDLTGRASRPRGGRRRRPPRGPARPRAGQRDRDRRRRRAGGPAPRPRRRGGPGHGGGAGAAGTAPDAVASGTGETALGGDTVEAVVSDLWRIALAALAAQPLLPRASSCARWSRRCTCSRRACWLAAGLGLTVLVFQGLLGYDGLTYYVPLATAVLLVSLGSDYNVFVAGRIWEEARTGGWARRWWWPRRRPRAPSPSRA